MGLDAWQALAERPVRCPEPVVTLNVGGPASLRIAPGISIHLGLTVLGQDWLPVRPGGVSTLEQMVHVPQTYLGKAKNVVLRDGRLFGVPQSQSTLAGKALLVGGERNYYHWLIDSLPRLLLARKYGLLEGWRVLVNDDLAPFQLDSLRLLGIPDERLVPVRPHEAVQADSVCVPTLLTTFTAVHPLVRTLLHDALPPKTAGCGRRIYLSRQDAATRRLVNEEDFVRLLARFGFVRLLPSQMSVQQQVDACAGADVVVAAHGAALANTLYCRPGTRVIELFSPVHASTFFVMLSKMCGLPHALVPVALVDPRPDLSPLHHQWEADLDAMERTLREQLGAPASA